jgi:hypothetical protein
VVILLAFLFVVSPGIEGRRFCTSLDGEPGCFQCSKACDGKCQSAFCFGFDPDCLKDGSASRSCTDKECIKGAREGACISSRRMLADVDGLKQVLECCTDTYCVESDGKAFCENPDTSQRACEAYATSPFYFHWEGLGGRGNCCNDNPSAQCDE